MMDRLMLRAGVIALAWLGLALLSPNPAIAGPEDPKPAKPAARDGKPKKETVTLDQLPAAAREALKKLLADAKPEKLEKETKKDAEFFVATWTVADREHKAKLTPEGKVVESEQSLEVADLPAAARQAAEKALPTTAEKVKCLKKTRVADGQAEVVYEVRGEVNGEKHHYRITPDGAVERIGPGAKGPKDKPQKTEQPA